MLTNITNANWMKMKLKNRNYVGLYYTHVMNFIFFNKIPKFMNEF